MSIRPSTPGRFEHNPVMLEESVRLLSIGSGSTVVDGTLGGGGHAKTILEKIGPDGRLIGLDVDAEALAAAAERLGAGERIRLVRASFRQLGEVLADLALPTVDAIFLDLGVSSRQLDTAERGFRFAEETADVTPLDMRMDDRGPVTAAQLLATATPTDLESWFSRYADLPGSRRLAHEIVQARRRAPLRTTRDLLDVIAAAGIGRGRRHNPATLVFQALRIAVNDEIGALEEGLEAGFDALRPGGRIAVIAYHSAEDRVVKNRFRDAARGRTGPPGMPEAHFGRAPRLRVLTRRPLRPTDAEVAANPRARSARLRGAERLAEEA